MNHAAINPWRPAEISDAPGIGMGHAPHPVLSGPIRPGLALVCGRHQMYVEGLVLGLSYKFPDWTPAHDAAAEAREIATGAVDEAMSELDATPEAAAIRDAREAAEDAEDRLSDALAVVAGQRREYERATSGGEYPDGLKGRMIESEDKANFLRQ